MPHEEYVIPDSGVAVEDLTSRLHDRLDGNATPTLVFAPNCWALPDVYVAMRDFYSNMPDQVGLLGFDNTDWVSVASPSVSTVVQPAYREGQQAARILIDLIKEAGEVDPHQVLSCDMHWGSSTR